MLELQAKIRDKKQKPEAIRKQGFLPAVLYGTGTENLSLQIEQKEFEKIYKKAGTSSFVTLKIGADKDFFVLINEIQKHVITGDTIHADFFQPNLKKEIHAKIPLEFIGEALAEKEGGILTKSIHEVEIKVLPKELPHSIEVDISALKTLEDNIAIKDLVIPKTAEILKDPDDIVVSVSKPKEEVEEEVAEETAEEIPAEEKAKEEEGKEKEGR
ncbi:MAG: 50S ribosomal protein L25 [Patescibacteria group bacterium]|nr:50S ribosomal protein L25 [Patescibacteria group bacterium]